MARGTVFSELPEKSSKDRDNRFRWGDKDVERDPHRNTGLVQFWTL
jgi:hypothetical protein